MRKESGVSLIESLMAMSLVSIVLITHIQALIHNEKVYNRNRKNSLAIQQAIDIMEQYSSRYLGTLADVNDFTTTNYLYNGIRFTRSLNVTANANASTTFEVTVTATTSGYSGNASLTKTMPLLRSR